MFGGIDWVCIAFLRKLKTIIILVKEVTITRIEGATERIVIRRTTSRVCEPSIPMSCFKTESSIFSASGFSASTSVSLSEPLAGALKAPAVTQISDTSRQVTTKEIMNLRNSLPFCLIVSIIISLVLFFALFSAHNGRKRLSEAHTRIFRTDLLSGILLRCHF